MSTYYQEINSAIIDWRDISDKIEKDSLFYNYLLNNRVASYYCKSLSKRSNDIEKSIVKAWDERNELFYKTIAELDRVCKENSIDYLLYKTHKYFDEVIWGDVDIIVKENDFDLFLKIFQKEWWDCEEDEKRKWKCEKEGYIVIEPHVNISWNWNTFFESKFLWEWSKVISINGSEYQKTNEIFESLSIYLKIIYEPEYLDLYDYLVLLKNKVAIVKFQTILKWHNQKLVNTLDEKINSIENSNFFPYFFSSVFIFKCNLINFKKVWYFNRRMFIHNFYWNLRYKKNCKLPYLTKYIEL
jgi:hypothetical protein